MAISPGQDRRTTRGRDRVRTKTIIQYATLRSQAADILVAGILTQHTPVNTPRLGSMVIREDKQDVGAILCRRFISGKEKLPVPRKTTGSHSNTNDRLFHRS